MSDIRDAVDTFKRGIEPRREVWTGWLVDHDGIGSAEVSDEPGKVYVLLDRGEGVLGDLIKAYSRIRPVAGWPVRIGSTRARPWEYTVLEVDEEQAGGTLDGHPTLEHHAWTHAPWGHPSGSDDPVFPRFMQLHDFSTWPGDGLDVVVESGVFNPTGVVAGLGLQEFLATVASLSDHTPSGTGHRYVLVTISPSGTVELTPGVWKSGFLTIDDIPARPSPYHWEVAAVSLSWDDTEITMTPTEPRILDLRFSRLGWPGIAGDGDGDGGVTDHGALTGLGDDDHTHYVLRNQWLQNGFLDASEVSLAWDDATRTLTVDTTNSSFRYFHDGVLYTKTAAQTRQITDTEGLWVFYFVGGTLTAANAPTLANILTITEEEVLVAYVYWDATNDDGRLMYDLHGAMMSPVTHSWLHLNIGAIFREGMVLGDFVIDDDGDDPVDAQFSVSSGKFNDEDIEIELAAIAKEVGLEIWYLDGADWRWTVNAGYSILTTGTGRMAWNNGGAQTEVTNNQFALCHVFATSITNDAGASPKYIAIQGQNEYATRKLARTGAETEINTLVYGTLPLQEVVPVATVIFQTNNGYGNAVKSRTVTTEAGDNYVDWRSSNIKATGGSIVDHGSLAGLADDDHVQYGSRILQWIGW